jgi:hypothetical protein
MRLIRWWWGGRLRGLVRLFDLPAVIVKPRWIFKVDFFALSQPKLTVLFYL